MLADKERCLALILEEWLEHSDDQRTEVRMFAFAFDQAASTRYHFSSPGNMYPQIRDYLYRHGKLTGPINGNPGDRFSSAGSGE